jgi:hypothetical protein
MSWCINREKILGFLYSELPSDTSCTGTTSRGPFLHKRYCATMSPIGPQLPPEMQKRKRSDDEESDGGSSDSSTRPAPPLHSKKQPSPPSTKRARVVGPAPPPAPLDERPPNDPRHDHEEESESDDDDFGPSLPSATEASKQASAQTSIGPRVAAPAPSAKRDEWMTLAPTNGDWSSRVDPTKLKGRKFHTGKGAKGPSQSGAGGDASWHETPEQKQERLRREVMGIKDTATPATSSRGGSRYDTQDDATARRLKEYNVRLKLPCFPFSPFPSLLHGICICLTSCEPLLCLPLLALSLTSYQETQRGPSLYASHAASQDKPLEDDPSARAFDREKDIGSGSTISATKRREMVKKSTDFSSRFEKAKYL